MNMLEVKITISLSTREALALLQETKDIKVGQKPALHELLDRIAEILTTEEII